MGYDDYRILPLPGYMVKPSDGNLLDIAALIETGGIPTKHSNAVEKVTILSGESLSGALDVRGYSSMAIYMPSAWTTANLTFAASPVPGGTFNPVYGDDGNEINVVAAASRMISIDIFSNALSKLHFIKFRSGTVGTAVNQDADRDLYILLKG